MSKYEKKISINVSIDKLKEALNKQMKFGSSNIIIDVIIGNLEKSPHGLEHLFYALIGVAPSCDYKRGDEVQIHSGKLLSWDKDFKAMEAQGMIFQGFVTGTVEQIDVYAGAPVYVKFEGITKSGLKDMFYENFTTDNLHLVKPDIMDDKDDKDLPF